MRRLIRMAVALAAVGALAALTTTAALAGNWAETSIIDGAEVPPTAGEERELRVMLLQHGMTPVDFGEVELTASLPGGEQQISVPATSLGGGEWTATITFPVEGDWQLRILHSELETPAASSFAVAPAPGAAWLPATASVGGLLLAAAALLLVARVMGGGRSRPADKPERVATPARTG